MYKQLVNGHAELVLRNAPGAFRQPALVMDNIRYLDGDVLEANDHRHHNNLYVEVLVGDWKLNELLHYVRMPVSWLNGMQKITLDEFI